MSSRETIKLPCGCVYELHIGGGEGVAPRLCVDAVQPMESAACGWCTRQRLENVVGCRLTNRGDLGDFEERL